MLKMLTLIGGMVVAAIGSLAVVSLTANSAGLPTWFAAFNPEPSSRRILAGPAACAAVSSRSSVCADSVAFTTATCNVFRSAESAAYTSSG